MEIIMKSEKVTKNTIRFTEVVVENENPKIGILYIPKTTLGILGWKNGNAIKINIEND